MHFHAFFAFLNRDVWGPMWPNVFAPSVFTVLGIAVSHFKLKKHHNTAVKSIHDRLDEKGPHG